MIGPPILDAEFAASEAAFGTVARVRSSMTHSVTSSVGFARGFSLSPFSLSLYLPLFAGGGNWGEGDRERGRGREARGGIPFASDDCD